MKYIDWDLERNTQLKNEREVSFEDVLIAFEDGNVLDIIEHINESYYPQVKFFIVNIDQYAYVVPFYEDDEKVSLQTIIPSRRATQKYLINKE